MPGYAGAISCFSGQTVHIASAQSRSAVTGAVPVVGGGPEGVGYQPIVGNPQSGAVLQVTPQLLPMHDTHAAVLDVCSVVTRSEGPAETLTFMSGASRRQEGRPFRVNDRHHAGPREHERCATGYDAPRAAGHAGPGRRFDATAILRKRRLSRGCTPVVPVHRGHRAVRSRYGDGPLSGHRPKVGRERTG